MALRRPFGSATIRVMVDGSEITVKSVHNKVRDAIKSSDTISVAGKTIVIELNDRNAAEAAPAIARRLKERLEDYDVDIEVDD